MLFAADAAEPGFPYWWEGLEWPKLEFSPPSVVDLLVIGAGYTGLSAALVAHDAGASVAVIDAGQPGKGASTRNGGMVGAHPRLSWSVLARNHGATVADGVFAEAGPALRWIENLIAAEEIDCAYERTGRIQLAYTAAHLEKQRRLAATISAKSDVACRMIEHGELPREVATPIYRGGLLFPDHAALDPARYHKGLLDAVLKRGVRVAAQTPAMMHEREQAMHVIRTPSGEIRARKVLLATNGYTGRPFAWFARRVFPVPSFLVATEPLSDNLIGELAPGRRMMVETRARHSYFRISPDGSRILFGGRAALVPIDLTTAARRLRATLAEIWPKLSGVRLSHVWTGNTGYSFGHMPHVGEVGDVHYAMGFSGSGTVLAPYLGAKAAWRALGDPRGDTAYARTALRPRWYHRSGQPPYFLRPADLWYRHWVDRREARAASR